MAPELIDIRRFSARDFLPLLQVESEVWDSELRWDYSSSGRTITACLAEKRLSGYALVEEGRIKGYCFFFYEGEKGLIGNLFVDPSSPRIDHAHRLLDHSIETLLATPGLRRVEMQLPHFTFEQLEPYFRAHHFEAYERRFMLLALPKGQPAARDSERERTVERAFAPNDFLLEPWDRQHDRQAAHLVYHTYRNHIDALINDQYGSEPGASRLIENIVRNRGCGEYVPKASLVAIHGATRKLAGILALTAVRFHTAHIPQVAVGREFQGAGLGTRMMEQGFQEVARRGFDEVTLTVTNSNSGAVQLYERLGFQTFRIFGAFVWKWGGSGGRNGPT